MFRTLRVLHKSPSTQALGISLNIVYFQISPNLPLPNILEFNPFRAVVIVEESVPSEWQHQVSSWLVETGCLFMMAYGLNCSEWDDSVDLANLEKHNHREIPEAEFVITTWHENESLKEVFWFCKNGAFHPTVEVENTVLIHISSFENRRGLIAEYSDA